MTGRIILGCVAGLLLAIAPASAQEWEPPRLANGVPDINGMWNNVGSSHVPLEVPDDLAGKTLTEDERLELFTARSDRAKAAQWEGHENSRGVGAYANYWFDWYWKEPVAGEAPALIIDPPIGKRPAFTEQARDSVQYYRDHLHDQAANMEAGDRCLSRGVFGMMMPTAYNNGKLIVQTEDHILIHSEMIHNARIIPIDSGPHVSDKITQWEGDPRGYWEGNTLVGDTRNFDPKQLYRDWSQGNVRLTERFTRVGADMLHYAVTFEDAAQWVTPWTAELTLRRTEGPLFEYACHEGNVGMANTLEMTRGEDGERP